MNWQHLTYFQITAELENFTRAAESLYITPSALSKAVRSLENELGFPLFEKQGRNVILTSFGKIFYHYVTKAADNLDEGLSSVHRAMGLQGGRISVAGIFTMCADYLPLRIKAFKEEYPDVTFSIDYQITSKILSRVLDGACDLGFCGDYDLTSAEYAELEYTLVKVEELVIIASKDHWLAEKPFVELSSLAKESFITYRNVNSGISYNFWPLFKDAGFTPQISFEVTDDHSILGLVGAGLGIALVADNPSLSADNVIARRIKSHRPTRNQYMVWKKNRFMSEAVVAFRDFILGSVVRSDLEFKGPRWQGE